MHSRRSRYARATHSDADLTDIGRFLLHDPASTSLLRIKVSIRKRSKIQYSVITWYFNDRFFCQFRWIVRIVTCERKVREKIQTLSIQHDIRALHIQVSSLYAQVSEIQYLQHCVHTSTYSSWPVTVTCRIILCYTYIQSICLNYAAYEYVVIKMHVVSVTCTERRRTAASRESRRSPSDVERKSVKERDGHFTARGQRARYTVADCAPIAIKWV